MLIELAQDGITKVVTSDPEGHIHARKYAPNYMLSHTKVFGTFDMSNVNLMVVVVLEEKSRSTQRQEATSC